jgi:hypothetical protein
MPYVETARQKEKPEEQTEHELGPDRALFGAERLGATPRERRLRIGRGVGRVATLGHGRWEGRAQGSMSDRTVTPSS